MSPTLTRFLEDGNLQAGALRSDRLLQLRQAQRGRKPGGSTADDEDVNLERLARHGTN